MMLADTNIIIDFWKNPDAETADIFINNEVAICGIIKAELIHGAKTDKEIKTVSEALDELIFLDINREDWLEIGKLMNKLKKKGVSIPFQDAVIAFIALKNQAELWTKDKHFDLIKQHYSDLRIYRNDKGNIL